LLSVLLHLSLPSMLQHCWLGGRKGTWPVKSGGAGVVICLGRGADLHVAKLMPLTLTPVKPGWFYLSGGGLPRLSWKKGR